MPTVGDNIIGEDRAVLEASLMSNILLNFREIIADEVKIRETRTKTVHPFPYLVIRLCEAAHVLEIIGLDQEFLARKTHNPIKLDKN